MAFVEDIFKLLGIKRKEVFKIYNLATPEVLDNGKVYRLKEDMVVEYMDGITNDKWSRDLTILPRILAGKVVIKKIIMPTKNEQLAIDYAKACGCNWLVKSTNGNVAGFRIKPTRGKGCWYVTCSEPSPCINIDIPISFLSWDDEPYYIGGKN